MKGCSRRQTTPDAAAFQSYAKDIAMQVAAATPTYLDKDSVPAETIAKEKEILVSPAWSKHLFLFYNNPGVL